MRNKPTPWFSSDTKPSHHGVYEVDSYALFGLYMKHPMFKYWNGVYWGMQARTPEVAFIGRYVRSVHQNFPWRGVLRKIKLTRRFKCDQKPVYPGVYKTILIYTTGLRSEKGWSRWNGRAWCNHWSTSEAASKDKMVGRQSKEWWGLASPP